MRIRTIKPEFWSHPVLSKAEDTIRLAAIGLLNAADDEGYFLASPPTIRSLLWPFDESSTKARRVLVALSTLGYIELREHQSHGQIGRVINFRKHQKIDRPSESKLKVYWPFDEPSTSPLRILDEPSLLEQGTGNREQGTGNRVEELAVAPLPEKTSQLGLLPTEQLKEHERRLLYVNEIVGRKNTTRWSSKEVRAYKAAGLDLCSVADFNEQLVHILAYYGAQVSALRPFWGSNNDGDFRRRTLLTLLNNWGGEVDRANAWRNFQSKNNEQRESARL